MATSILEHPVFKQSNADSCLEQFLKKDPSQEPSFVASYRRLEAIYGKDGMKKKFPDICREVNEYHSS